MKWLSDLAIKVLAPVLARKAEALMGSIWLSSLSVSISLRSYLAQFVPFPTDEWAVLTTGAAIAALATALFSYFWFRPKLEPTGWGTHKNIKTGAYFCSTCLIPNKVHSPMYLSSDSRFWRCHSNSNHKKVNPDFKEPEQPPSPPPHAQSWMA